MQQVIQQVADAPHHAVAPGVEDLLEGQGVEQGIGRRNGIIEQGKGKVCPGPVVFAHAAVVDPVAHLLLPAQVGLQAAPVEGVEAPGRVGEAVVLGVGLVQGFPQQHTPQLAAQGQGMPGTVQRIAQAVGRQAAQGGEQVPAAQAGDRALRIDIRGG